MGLILTLKYNVDVIAENLPSNDKAEGSKVCKELTYFSGILKSAQLSPENGKEGLRSAIGVNLHTQSQ